MLPLPVVRPSARLPGDPRPCFLERREQPVDFDQHRVARLRIGFEQTPGDIRIQRIQPRRDLAARIEVQRCLQPAVDDPDRLADRFAARGHIALLQMMRERNRLPRTLVQHRDQPVREAPITPVSTPTRAYALAPACPGENMRFSLLCLGGNRRRASHDAAFTGVIGRSFRQAARAAWRSKAGRSPGRMAVHGSQSLNSRRVKPPSA